MLIITPGGCEPFAGEPRSQEAEDHGITPGERQLGELFYVTMILPIKQGMRLTANLNRTAGPAALGHGGAPAHRAIACLPMAESSI